MYAKFDKILRKKGITAYAVSKGTGIPGSTFSDWKSGKSSPKVDKLIKIADYLGIELEELIREQEG
jgi:transcriptional regulator with XRE-family HTH domain